MLPLEGILVVDLTRLLPGPYCSMILADLGAEVIKVEPPGGDYMREFDPVLNKSSALYYAVNRNKKSVELNLKDEKDAEFLRSIIKKADVFMENNRPGVMKRLGFDYDSVRKIKEDIIYCSITGFGYGSPYSNIPAHDINFIAMSSVLSQISLATGFPVLPNIQIADITSSLWAAIAIMAAIVRRNNTGQGAFIDLSMFDATLSWLVLLVSEYSSTGKLPVCGKTMLSGKYPCYRVYETKDGRYVVLGALESKFWKTFCETVGREDLIPYQYSTDSSVMEEVEGIFKSKSYDEWEEIARSLPETLISPVKDLAGIINDVHVKVRNLLWEVNHPVDGRILTMGLPFKFNDIEFELRKQPPDLNEDREELEKLLTNEPETY